MTHQPTTETYTLSLHDALPIYNAGSAGKCRTCTSPPPNTLSWWPGEGNVNDIQGNNNGTLEGSTTFAPGKIGQAFKFNGNQSDGINLGDVPSFNFAPTDSFS